MSDDVMSVQIVKEKIVWNVPIARTSMRGRGNEKRPVNIENVLTKRKKAKKLKRNQKNNL